MSEPRIAKILGELVPARRPGELVETAVAPFPEMFSAEDLARMDRARCHECGEEVVVLRPDPTGGVRRRCCLCAVRALAAPGAEAQAERLAAEWAELRRRDPRLLRELVVAFFNRAGVARVTPATARRPDLRP